MEQLISYGFLAPPNVFIVVCLFGVLIALVWRRAGIIVTGVASLCLFVAATPAFSSCLLAWLEANIPEKPDFGSAQAIVVPCADSRAGHGAVADMPGLQSLERLVLVADAYKQLHLPVLVTGGSAPYLQTSCAEIMKSTLEKYFLVPVTWTEDRSGTTYQNAVNTAQLLQNANVHTVILVTQARDAPRAIWSFEQTGLQALPWTTPRERFEVDDVSDFLPSTQALLGTFYALHELVGDLYYRFRYQKSVAS